MGVASGSGWNLWVWLVGVVVRRYIDFLILLIPTPLVSVLFCSSIPFCSCFSFLSYYAVSVIKIRDGGQHTVNQLLCHDCHFRLTPSAWKLRYRYTLKRGSAVKHIRLIRDKTMCLTDEYALTVRCA